MTSPSGTITFLFTDIAGSTPLWEKMPHAMGKALLLHDGILRQAIEEHGGVVFKTVGDAFHAVFVRAEDALAASIAGQVALKSADWGEIEVLRVRMALHTGTAEERDADYHGPAVNRVARLLSLAHPGQVLVSRATADLLVDSAPAGASLRDLGEYQLRGMSRPERIYQVLHAELSPEFSPLRSVEVIPTNIVPQLSSFVGRQEEQMELQAALRRSRLVTLTGAGGSGKTRLSIESALEAMSLFEDGAWFCELAPLAEGSAVPRSVLNALNMREQSGRSILETLTEELKTRNLLLILDNCEHVLDAAAEVTEAILRAAPCVHILATSREAIGVQGESVIRIPSMGVPSDEACTVEDLIRFDATRLFIERSRAANKDFEVTESNCQLIVQICRRLDGIPLAIELAASRMRAMALSQVAERLDDRFRILTGGSRTAVSRQRTLRALIDWSYDLLSEEERSLLRSASVFSGGWTLEALETVGAANGIEPQDVLDLLTQLVEKSLVVCDLRGDGDARYRMLETIRQYAADKLADEHEAEGARTRHLRFFQSLLEARDLETSREIERLSGRKASLGEALLYRPQGLDMSYIRSIADSVSADWDNVRAAIEWALATEPLTGLTLATNLSGFYEMTLRIVEGGELLKKALKVAEQLESSAVKCAANLCAARLAFRRVDIALAKRYAQAAIQIGGDIGYEKSQALGMILMGNALTTEDESGAASQLYLKAVALGEKLGDRELLARGTYALMLRARDSMNLPEFGRLLDKSEFYFNEAGMGLWAAWTRSYRGSYAEETGQFGEAAKIYADAMEKLKGVQDGIGGIWHWECIGRVCASAGRPDVTAILFGSAQAHRRRISWPVQPSELPRNEKARGRAVEELGDTYAGLFKAGQSMSYAEASSVALEAALAIAADSRYQ